MSVDEGVCRLCLGSGARDSIYGAELHERAMVLARIHIAPGDGLPERVCDNCATQVSTYYRFKVLCENTERSLRTLLSISCPNLQPSNISNFDIKQEISFENEDKPSLTNNICTDDSSDRHSPCIAENYSIDDSLFSQVRLSNSPVDKKPGKKEVDNKENQTVKNESTKKLYPKLRIRRESLIADKSVEVKNNNKSPDVAERFEVDIDFPSADVTYLPTISSEDENKDEIPLIDATGTFVCHLCGKEYSREKHLQRHLQTSCDTLPKNKKQNLKKKTVKFRKKRVLKLLKIHSESIQPHESFIDKSVIGDNKNFMCDVCGCIYKKLNILLQHQTTHSDIKNHSCNICKKKFTRRSHLGAHMRIHNNIKPYVCETCGISFVKSSDLSRHKRIHSDARNYACPICPRRFKRSGDVTSHMRVHTGDRPYKCKACNKAYSSHSSLQKHRKLKCQAALKFNGNDDIPGDIKPKTEVQI